MGPAMCLATVKLGSKSLCARHSIGTWRSYATYQEDRSADAAFPKIPAELLDQIVKGPMSADAVNAARLCHHSRRFDSSEILGALRNDSGSIRQRIQRTGGGATASA